MSYYKSNIELLKKTSQKLYNQVINEYADENVVFSNEDEKNTILIAKDDMLVNMHSEYDASFELNNMFTTVKADVRVLILFGLGDGRALKYAKNTFPDLEKIVVVEPSLTWFKCFINNYKFIDYVKGISVSLIVNKNAVDTGAEIGRYINDTNTSVVYHLSYKIIYGEYYASMMTSVKNNVLVRASNYAFRRESNEAIALNFIQNIKYGFNKSESIAHVFKDKPLLVVAAGPSLSKNMHLIEAIKQKAVVVAVGSAIKILDSNGIVPHFRMAFDPFLAEKKVVEKLNSYDVPLIFSHTLFFDVLPNYPGEKIAVDITSDHGKHYINKKENIERQLIQSASSIAISAADLGVKYGSSKIIVIGFDASFTSDKLYADGVGNRNEEITKKLNQPGVYESIDIYGNSVLTNKGFYMNKLGLELVVEHNPGTLFINATEGGLPTNGAKIMKLNDVLTNELNNDFNIDSEITFSKSIEDATLFDDHVKTLFKGMLEEIELIESVNDNRLKKIKKLLKYSNSSIQKSYIEKELLSMKSYESELQEIDLYKHFIYGSLKEIYNGILDVTRYNGFDSDKKTKSELDKYMKISAEIARYCILIKDIIQMESNGKLYDKLIDDLNNRSNNIEKL